MADNNFSCYLNETSALLTKPELTDDEFNRLLRFQTMSDRAWEKSGREAQDLFGNKETLPADELEVVFDNSLSHTDKLAKLQVMRGQKTVKPKSFRKRITNTDPIYARALGVKL